MWELVKERLLHEELKLKEKNPEDSRKVFVADQRNSRRPIKQYTCHFCKKPGHFKRYCRKYLASQKQRTAEGKEGSESDREALVTTQALASTSSGGWIVDSGATCHMCKDEGLFGS